MKKRDTNLRKASRGEDQMRGFSMIELVLVVAVIMIVVSMALIQLQPTIQQFHANAASDQIKGALRQARELAISSRRCVQVTFAIPTPGVYTISLTRACDPNGPTLLYTLPIEGTVKFMNFAGAPDTPDGFGKAAPIMFGGVANGPATGMFYQSDGTFTNGTGNPINGTVWMGVPGVISTARAVTVLGGTGRVRAYHYNGTAWVQ